MQMATTQHPPQATMALAMPLILLNLLVSICKVRAFLWTSHQQGRNLGLEGGRMAKMHSAALGDVRFVSNAFYRRRSWNTVSPMMARNDDVEISCEECDHCGGCSHDHQNQLGFYHGESLRREDGIQRNRDTMRDAVERRGEKNTLKSLSRAQARDDRSSRRNVDWTRRELLSMISVSSAILGGTYSYAPAANAEVAKDDKSCFQLDDEKEGDYDYDQQEEYKYPDKPLIPFSSVRQQKLLTLSNGLKVLLVNDINSSQSSAALIVRGPGQFQDPDDLPGAAHLMEHMIMSHQIKKEEKRKRTSVAVQKDGDIEEWLGEYGGSSNAFTAYDRTCYHLNCPHDIFPEALDKFASIFVQDNVFATCMNEEIVKREIRRVDEELDVESLAAKQEYLTKSYVENLINVDQPHPYSKFSRGSIDSLERIPNLKGIDVSKKLIQFFQDYYLPTETVLVVVSNLSSANIQPNLPPLSTMERWVAKFDKTMSNVPLTNKDKKYHYPGQFKRPMPHQNNHLILRQKGYEGAEKMVLRWILNLDYYNDDDNITNVFEVAFVLNRILCRRTQGSLYEYLRKRDWIQNRSTVPPQVTVPINVSGFQILKLEFNLTYEGFRNRAKVVAAVYESIETIRNNKATIFDDSFQIPKEIISQYATTAKLFGYLLSPRPPDAVELALDSIDYGTDATKSMMWYRFPSLGEGLDKGSFDTLNSVQGAVRSAFKILSDPKNALIIVVAAADNVNNVTDTSLLQPLPIPKLKGTSIGNSYFFTQNMYSSKAQVMSIDDTRELRPPSCNSLIPHHLRPPRIIKNNLRSRSSTQTSKYPSTSIKKRNSNWIVLEPNKNTLKLQLPRSPPELSCRCAFVLQLLSPRPIRSNAEQAAYGELWKQSFEDAAMNWAELGASGGFAYEVRFNKYGMRISFMGVSQSLSHYAKKLIEILIENQNELLGGRRSLNCKSIAIAEAKRIREISPARKNAIIYALENARAQDVALEGLNFLQSCSGAVCFSQGDLTSTETQNLLFELQELLQGFIVKNKENQSSILPSINDLLDNPVWKPRNASPCYIAGVSLMSDACGRVLR